MPIPVSCSGCGKRFKAPDKGAGKKAPCPNCKTIISIPAAAPEPEEEEYRLAPQPEPIATTPRPSGTNRSIDNREPTAGACGSRSEPPFTPSPSPSPAFKRAWVPPTRSSTPTWLRHLHWCLALAMIPLAVSIFVPDRSDDESVAQAPQESPAVPASAAKDGKSPPPVSGKAAPATQEPSGDDEARLRDVLENMSPDELFALLPGHKLPGALLARDSYLHWLFALLAAALYLTFLVFLASDKSAQPLHLLGLGLFTATGGILLLLFVQVASTMGSIRVRGPAGFVLLILLLIGLSYSAALDPDTGLIVSFVGFTCGVGLCEEVCKALPLLVYYRIGNNQSWRGAFLWGLASGTGFAVSEGIMYSQSYYNGISGSGIYLVRFVSCVALHAIWAGSIGISINQRQYLLQGDAEEWWEYALSVLRIIAVPMVLHGLYDTLLKKDLDFFALLTAIASFGYLAWQISHLRGEDDDQERAAYVAQYIRAKTAAARA